MKSSYESTWSSKPQNGSLKRTKLDGCLAILGNPNCPGLVVPRESLKKDLGTLAGQTPRR